MNLNRYILGVFISLWITLPAFGWGELGHKIIAQYGTELTKSSALKNCHVTAEQIIEHTNDPDKIWRDQRFKHPNEAQMHFFHVDRQPLDWRAVNKPTDTKQGRLVYHLIDWVEDARDLKKEKKWSELAEHIYGISHYIGDLTQPLHLHHDYDGREAGLPDLHAQFETKMLNRFEKEIRAGVQSRLAKEKLPEYWSSLSVQELVLNTAEQSNAKVERLFHQAKPALILPHISKRRKTSHKPPQPRFDKKILFEESGQLAEDQLALGAKILGYVLNSICQ